VVEVHAGDVILITPSAFEGALIQLPLFFAPSFYYVVGGYDLLFVLLVVLAAVLCMFLFALYRVFIWH